MAPQRIKVSILLADGAEAEAVAKAAAALGAAIEQVLPAIGVVSASAPPGLLDRLRALKGVEAVEESRTYRPA
jgi:hypothetical protein